MSRAPCPECGSGEIKFVGDRVFCASCSYLLEIVSNVAPTEDDPVAEVKDTSRYKYAFSAFLVIFLLLLLFAFLGDDSSSVTITHAPGLPPGKGEGEVETGLGRGGFGDQAGGLGTRFEGDGQGGGSDEGLGQTNTGEGESGEGESGEGDASAGAVVEKEESSAAQDAENGQDNTATKQVTDAAIDNVENERAKRQEDRTISPVTIPKFEGKIVSADDIKKDATFAGAGKRNGKGGGLSGRGDAGRAAALEAGGGTKLSEEAVELALKWIVAHQNPDGSWSFDHTAGGARCACRDPGTVMAANGATGLALLPLLGAGNTHKTGKYKKEVFRGLSYLIRNQAGDGGLTDSGGRMYSHGLAAIAINEAFALEKEPKELGSSAFRTLRFIQAAQDPVGGGWRYRPRQSGDTSVLGWQMMALLSGHLAGIKIHDQTLIQASRFLTSVQGNSGATYGYTAPGQSPANTAIGLLCRMYLGWGKNIPALNHGVDTLSQWGPDPRDLYYSYYATQVLHHYGGTPWKKWNEVMRDSLVESQAKQGHERGSWAIRQKAHGASGGRLYCTALATMILEVYYRHMPLYAEKFDGKGM